MRARAARRASPRRRAAEAGFSLIEILAVVAILVVVSAVALPALGDRLERAKFDAAVARIDTGLVWARAEAQRRAAALRVVGVKKDGVWGLELEEIEREESRDQGSENSQEKPIAERFAEFGAGVEIETGAEVEAETGEQVPLERVAIGVFLPDGTVMAQGSVRLVGGGRAAAIVLNQWTGGVRVEEQKQEEKREQRAESREEDGGEGEE